MKTKMIMGISIAAALCASAIGGTLMYKTTTVNHTVYAKSVSSVKNVEKENVTLYIPKQTETATPIIHDGKKYTMETYSSVTGKLMPANSDSANFTIKDSVFLGNTT